MIVITTSQESMSNENKRINKAQGKQYLKSKFFCCVIQVELIQ